MKRLAGVAAATVTLAALFAGTASAQEGAPGFEIKEETAEVKAEGPGFETKLSPDDLRVEIDDESFGIPEAGFPIQRSQTDLGPVANNLRPFVCEEGTYRLVSGILRRHPAGIEHRATAAALHAGLRPGIPQNHHVRRHAGRRRDRSVRRAVPPAHDRSGA